MAYEIRDNLTNVNYTWNTNWPEWIVIHNTANGTSAEGTAYANTQYFKDYDRSASAHLFIDDGDIVWRCVRDTDSAWHCGDSYSRNGCTNYNSIGIETCERADGSFSEHEIDVLSWLVPQLMEKYGIDADHVCRHYDVTTKICPAGYIDNDAWEELKDRITGGSDMTIDELFNTLIATGDDGNIPLWQAWSWAYTYAKRADAKCAELEERVKQIEAGNVNYEELAKAVCDEQYKRMQD